jgi:hypothetical protein
MVTSLNSQPAYQDFQYEAEQVIVGSLDFNSAATTTIGGLPAGAMVTGIVVVVSTLFNGTTPTITVGIINASGVATATYYVSSGTSLAAAGVIAATLAATALPLATNSTVTVTRSETGSSAGAAKVIVRFVGP